MKLPEHSLKKAISIETGPMSEPIEFPPGTLVQPFSDYHVPSHIKEEIEEKLKSMPNDKEYVVCLIGTTWIPVPKEDIRKE